jgi:hypothetical protein
MTGLEIMGLLMIWGILTTGDPTMVCVSNCF